MEVNNALTVPTGTDVPADGETPGQTAKASKPKGRPKASSDGGEKRGRGRPKKSESSSMAKDQKSEAIEILAESLRKAGETISPNLEDLQFNVAGGATSSGGESIPKAKRSRGRPRKNPDQPPKPKPPPGDGPKRGRGRPRKRPLDEAVDQQPSKQPRVDGDNEEGADVSIDIHC